MAKNHGAKQQKRLAKQKAKRAAKHAFEHRRSSQDPTIRLQQAQKWPVVHAIMGAKLWDDGIGHLMIARQQSEGQFVFAIFLVDVYCLGVKDAFWRAGTRTDVEEMIRKIEKFGGVRAITPEYFAKVVTGAVEYAQSFSFPPHPDYRHASLLLQGVDASTCATPCTFGKDGKPYYIQGPNESFAEATAISQRIEQADGHFLIGGPMTDTGEISDIEREFEDSDDDTDERDVLTTEYK